MPDNAQQFLNVLDKKLWNAADRLRASLDAAVYKHAVLGLIFLKYVSDSFRMRQEEVAAALKDPEHDYYTAKNVFWVPALARWKTLQDNAKLSPGTKITVSNGKKEEYEIKPIVSLIVEMLEPYRGRVYDPAMGSGGFFVQSERFIQKHGGKLGNLSVYGQLFTNTQIPACIWFLTKNKAGRPPSPQTPLPEREGLSGLRDRRGETLFIDARQLGYMKDRVLRDFTAEDKAEIAGTFQKWKRGKGYEDEAGFCKSATLEEIATHDHVLTPGRYVGAANQEDDGEPFAEKMARLTAELDEQFASSARMGGAN
jgi:type I restriction-modification system DNA methylase subunit